MAGKGALGGGATDLPGSRADLATIRVDSLLRSRKDGLVRSGELPKMSASNVSLMGSAMRMVEALATALNALFDRPDDVLLISTGLDEAPSPLR